MNLNEIFLTYLEIPLWAHFFILTTATFLENVFPPVPGDVIVVLYGALSAKGFSLVVISSAIFTGNMLGGAVCFHLGSKILPLLRRLQHKSKLLAFADEELEARAGSLLSKHGVLFIGFSRFLPAIRFFISIVAGMFKMKPIAFYAAFLVGVLAWNSLLIQAGIILSTDWSDIRYILQNYTILILSLISLLLAMVWFWRRKVG